MSIALYSRWPPPIVPSIACAVTIMRVPAGRGTEPFAATTVTSIASRPAASSADSASIQSFMGAPRRAERTASIAFRMASPVAGASSGGLTR